MDDSKAIQQLEAALALQKKAFLKNQYPPLDERKANIGKIATMVMTNKDAIREALNQDFGNHPHAASDITEILGVAGRAQYVASQVDAWNAVDVRHVDPQMFGGSKAEVRYQPKGVIGIIVPWNFPSDLSLGPLCEMLAGGNRVIIKPSEFTPTFGALMAKMIAGTFPEDLVTVVNGGLDLSRKFTRMKWNHLLYTGNPEVGKLVMAEAAKNLVPVTLELGGKCPAIMTAGSVTEENVGTILSTKLLKSGQMCVSIDYVVCPEKDVETFTKAAQNYFDKNLPNYTSSKDCTGIISERHFSRLQKMVSEAETAGTKSIKLGGDSIDKTKRALPLTLLLNPAKELSCMQEEIFGPILPIIPYTKLDDAIDEINTGERPLGLYVFGDDTAESDAIIANTSSGGVGVNSCAMQAAIPSLGFGGSGNSGMGRHHGIEGFREFTNPRGVFTRGPKRDDIINAFGPPYAMGEAVAAHAYAQAGI